MTTPELARDLKRLADEDIPWPVIATWIRDAKQAMREAAKRLENER